MFLPLFTAAVVHLPEKRSMKKEEKWKWKNSFILLIFQTSGFCWLFCILFHCHSSTLSPSWHFSKKREREERREAGGGGVFTFWIIKWLIIVWLLLYALLLERVVLLNDKKELSFDYYCCFANVPHTNDDDDFFLSRLTKETTVEHCYLQRVEGVKKNQMRKRWKFSHKHEIFQASFFTLLSHDKLCQNYFFL